MWKNATRNPLKLQELIEQEQRAPGERAREAGRKIGGRREGGDGRRQFEQLDEFLVSICSILGGSPSVRPSVRPSVGRSTRRCSGGPRSSRRRSLRGRPSKRGLKRRETTWMELEKRGFHLWNSGDFIQRVGRERVKYVMR